MRALGEAVDKEFAQIDGVGTLLYGRARLLSEAETHDLGWFVACLCTPLLGEDLAEYLPRYRPDSLLARETNGDLALLLPRWRQRIAAGDDTEEARRPLIRFMSRHLVRTGFTLVMPRWNGWTSDLAEMAEVFGAYYPQRADQLRAAAVLGASRRRPRRAAVVRRRPGTMARRRVRARARREGPQAGPSSRAGESPARAPPFPLTDCLDQPVLPQVLQLRPHRQFGRRPQRAVHVRVHVGDDLGAACRGPSSTAVSTWARRWARWAR